ncbi:MAG: hypothetical protein OXU20_03225 [Myxococcales bacterium]|nr:hypothetical protein [Myxococcales bacterium]
MTILRRGLMRADVLWSVALGMLTNCIGGESGAETHRIPFTTRDHPTSMDSAMRPRVSDTADAGDGPATERLEPEPSRSPLSEFDSGVTPDNPDSGHRSPDRGGAPLSDAGAEPPSVQEAGAIDPTSRLEEHYQSCVALVSCYPNPGYNLSECIHMRLQGTWFPGACARRVRTCGDVLECLGVSRWQQAEACVGPPGWRCDGDLATYCGSEESVLVDCTRLGATCRVPTGGDAFLAGRFPCLLPLPESCQEGEVSCFGDYAYRCVNDKPYGQSCSHWGGGACVRTSEMSAACMAWPKCEAAGTLVCSGDLLEHCNRFGRLVRHDCGFVGDQCVIEELEDAQIGYCAGPRQTPESVRECQEHCDGSVMNLCLGQPEALDCRDYGFAHCASGINAAGRIFVHCASALERP